MSYPDDSMFTDSLALLAELREKIEDGKVTVTGYSIGRNYRQFEYLIKVEARSAPAQPDRPMKFVPAQNVEGL